MRNISILFFCSTILFFSCNRSSKEPKKRAEHIKYSVEATVETTPMPHTSKDDSADDPAIWINTENTVLIGTDKKGGLATYNLNGEQLKYYPYGNLNNCDLRYGFYIGGDTIDVLAASNRSNQSLSLYKISKGGVLDSIHCRKIKSGMQDEVYGLCMYKSKQKGKMYVFMNSKAGEVEQFELFAFNNNIDAKLVRTLRLNSQTEGMVADDEKGILYVGEENVGIWKFDAEPTGLKDGTLIPKSSEENQNIKYDIEGLAIYDMGNGKGYLIASSQGNDSYAVFERQGMNKYLGSFRITDGLIDGVEGTDGLDVTSQKLPGFEKGFLIVQDGDNYEGERLASQNFKIIPWTNIEDIIQTITG
jgi:3-phytase